jgi:hypothetical protein
VKSWCESRLLLLSARGSNARMGEVQSKTRLVTRHHHQA